MKYNNDSIYTGNWVNDKKEGNGKILFSNQDEYIGIWKNDQFINGKKIFINGDEYNGNCINGLNEGYGIMKYNNGNIIMEKNIKDFGKMI